MKKILFVVLISIVLVINGWRFINGEMVHLPISGTKNISVPFKIDPNFEETLQYIRTLPQDGKILTLPLTDFGYQLLGGTEGGLYIGPSMIGYLTDKKDYPSYNGFGSQGELLLKFIKEKDYKAVKNIFAIHNIRYVYFNQDPYIFDNFLAFPYQTTKEVLPTLDSYREFLRSLQVEEIFKKGSYHLYKLPEDSYSPIIYATNAIVYTESLEDVDYVFPFYSFASSRLAVVQGKQSEIIRARKIDIYTRINKDYPLPVLYPFARWKLNSPVYPFVIFKENNRLGCISGYIDPEIDCDLFYSLKRISELARWEGGIPVLRNVVHREDLLRNWQEPNIFDFKLRHTYNSWEASLARYVSEIDKVARFIESQNKGLVWEIEKKSKVTEILLENQRILNLIIKNSQKPEKNKVYTKQLLDEIFAYYLEKVKNTTYDPSRLEYVIPNIPEKSGPYEILMENSSNNKIEPADMVLSVDDKEYKPLPHESNGWINFGQIDQLTKESLATVKIPQTDMANDSLWQVGGTFHIIKNSEFTRLETVSHEFEGFSASIKNVTSLGHYLLSFDYETHGDVFEAAVFLFEKNEAGNPEVTQLFQEPKLSDVWRKMSVVIEVEKPTDIVVQIKPSKEARSIDVKNLSFVKLPPHPEVILRKIGTQQLSQIPDINFITINPTKYRIDVSNVSNPYTLVFSQAFSKKWNLIDTTKNDIRFLSRVERFLGTIGHSITRTFQINTAFLNETTFETWGKRVVARDSHMVVNGYANGWLVSPTDMDRTDYTLVLEITSQRMLYYYLLIAIIALTASIVVVITVQLAGRFKNRR